MPNTVENIFYHADYKCVIVLTSMGHRCGYVAVKENDVLFGIQYSYYNNEQSIDLSNIDVHGGLTYSAQSYRTTYPTNQFDKVWYFGFDCNHLYDAPDLEAFARYSPKDYQIKKQFLTFSNFREGKIRTQQYVEQECKLLAEQLRKISLNHYKRETSND